MTAVIGVDIGTTSTKVISFHYKGNILAEESAGYSLNSPRPGRADQDPDEILEAVLDSLTKVVHATKYQGYEVAGVSFSAAMHSLLALDSNGDPLTPALIYADHRASEQATRIRKDLDGTGLHRRTGTPIHPMSPLTKILWFKEEAPDTFEATAKWISIKEYIFFRLFGEYLVDHSIASSTGMFNLENLDWDETALQVAGVSREKLSQPVSTTHVIDGMKDELADRLGLKTDTPFVVGANDGVLANLGLGATESGVVACSIGTSGAVRSVVDRPQVDEGGKLFCYALTEEKWVIGGPINNGGIALQWAVEELFPDIKEEAEERGQDPHDLASEWAEEVAAGAEGVIFLPYLTGERAPYWNSDARGVFFGLSLQHGRRHLIRAVMEGVIYQMYAVQRALEEVIGEPKEIRATGGFAQSVLWRQIMADVYGREIAFPDSYESSCLGAALLGMKALNIIDSLEAANEMIRISTRHQPIEENAAVYEKLVQIFDRLYEQLEPQFTEISNLQL
ncbi:MAG: gluconokinase [Rubrobacteraceae bacterium]